MYCFLLWKIYKPTTDQFFKFSITLTLTFYLWFAHYNQNCSENLLKQLFFFIVMVMRGKTEIYRIIVTQIVH